MRIDTRVYWNERLTGAWNLTGVGYRALGNGFNEWAYGIRRWAFRRALPEARPGARACDIGAGTGFYVEELLRAGYSVTGVDISSVAVGALRERFPRAIFVEGDVSDTLSGTYECITAMDVLFHIVDDEKYEHALKNIARALAPGGMFIFSDNFPSQRVSHTHQVSRSESEIYTALAVAGFEVRSRRPMFVLMNAPVKRTKTRWWKALEGVLIRAPYLGAALGAFIFPLELFLTTIVRRTSSTEIVVCVKR